MKTVKLVIVMQFIFILNSSFAQEIKNDTEDKQVKTYVSGKILDPVGKKVFLYTMNFINPIEVISSKSLIDKSNFQFEIFLVNPTYINIYQPKTDSINENNWESGRNFKFYIEPGDSLDLKIKLSEEDRKPQFTGRGTMNNIFENKINDLLYNKNVKETQLDQKTGNFPEIWYFKNNYHQKALELLQKNEGMLTSSYKKLCQYKIYYNDLTNRINQIRRDIHIYSVYSNHQIHDSTKTEPEFSFYDKDFTYKKYEEWARYNRTSQLNYIGPVFISFSKKKAINCSELLSKKSAFIDTVDVINNEAILLEEYLYFLKAYINLQRTRLTGNVNYLSINGDHYISIYNLANFLLRDKPALYIKAYAIRMYLFDYNSKRLIAPALLDFKYSYPEEKVTRFLDKKYNELSDDIFVGSPAPGLNFKDHSDKNVKLADFKGNVVVLTFWKSDTFYLPDNVFAIRRIAKYYPDSIKFVFIDINKDKSLSKRAVEKFNLPGIHLFSGNNEELFRNFPNLLSKFNNNSNNIMLNQILVIGKDGKIEAFGINLIDELDYFIKNELKQNYQKETNKSGLFNILIITFLNFAVGGLIIWGILKWRTKIIRKREEQKRKVTELELRAIRSQMNPHFMFNSLSSIQNLVNKMQIKEANLYLAKFAGLMRMILSNSEKQLVPLSEELEAVRTYCELESLRFSFEYTIEIDKHIDIYNTEVPGMLLQPYVENAILHGLAYLEGKTGKVEIKISQNVPQNGIKNDDVLFCTIEDNGVGRMKAKDLRAKHNISEESRNPGNGFGIKLTADRINILREQYHKDLNIEIIDKVDEQGTPTGTLVKITIPVDG